MGTGLLKQIKPIADCPRGASQPARLSTYETPPRTKMPTAMASRHLKGVCAISGAGGSDVPLSMAALANSFGKRAGECLRAWYGSPGSAAIGAGYFFAPDGGTSFSRRAEYIQHLEALAHEVANLLGLQARVAIVNEKIALAFDVAAPGLLEVIENLRSEQFANRRFVGAFEQVLF